MRLRFLAGLLLIATGLAFADPIDSTEIGVAEVRTLGTLNGQALACRQFAASSEAKTLMIGYVPKTRRYGILFETATNAAFLASTQQGTPCAIEADLIAQLAESATALKAVFPEQAEPNGAGPAQVDPVQVDPVQVDPIRSSEEGGS